MAAPAPREMAFLLKDRFAPQVFSGTGTSSLVFGCSQKRGENYSFSAERSAFFLVCQKVSHSGERRLGPDATAIETQRAIFGPI